MNKKRFLVCFLVAILGIMSVLPAFAAKSNNKVNANSPQAKLNIALKEVKAIDSKLITLTKKEVKLPKVKKNSEQQTAYLWTNKGTPVKLVVTELDDIGKISGQSTYYFKNGKLLLLKAPFSNHLFENDKMILWLDENMKVLTDIPKKDMNNSSASIIKYTNKILKCFK